MSLGLDAKHISSALNLYEAARTAFFTLVVEDLDNIIKASYAGDPAAATDSDRIAKAQEYLQLNVVKFDVPHFKLDTAAYKRGNEEIKFATTPSFDSGTITVDDVIGLDTKSILMAWQGLAYNVHTRKGGRMKDYKKNCTLVEYTQDGVPVRSWRLYGCFITSINEDSFDKESDGKRQISANIEYDRAEMIME